MINDVGEPILYPKELFDVIDRLIPPNWQFREFAEGEYFLDPVATGRPGFYEEFFFSDGDRDAQVKADHALRET